MNSDGIRRVWWRLIRILGRENGPAFDTNFNVPVRFRQNRWYVNERIVELPFVFRHLPSKTEGIRVLEFGCTRSTLALSLASLGYEVTGVDLRPYPFEHTNLHVFLGNILELEKVERFDVITAVSVLEHVGLGAYGEDAAQEALRDVVHKLVSLLNDGGKLLLTVPIGRTHVNHFLRSFAPAEIKTLFTVAELELVGEEYYCREALREYSPCRTDEVKDQDNSKEASGPTGVNGVGCFVWMKETTKL